MTADDFIQTEAEKYLDGRENDPVFRKMITTLAKLRDREKYNRPKIEKQNRDDLRLFK